MNFTCELDGVREYELTCLAVKKVMGAGCVRGVDVGIREAVADMKSNHTFKNQSGRLEKSIGGSVEASQQSGAVGEIHASEDYASFVEDPTKPHVIRPKADAGTMGPLNEGQSKRSRGETKALRERNRVRGLGYTAGTRVLSWVTDGGVRHFARVVHHPGTRGQPFMGPGHLKAERVCEREINASVPAAQAEIDR